MNSFFNKLFICCITLFLSAGSHASLTDSSLNFIDNTSIDILGSDLTAKKGGVFKAKTVNFGAGTDTTSNTSQNRSKTLSGSYSTGGNSAQVSASVSQGGSRSGSTRHVNSNIQVGNLTVKADKLTVAGANVASQGDVDIDVDELDVRSLQDTSYSSSHSKSVNVSGSVGSGGVMPTGVGGSKQNSHASRQWVGKQTSLIGATSGNGNVRIRAKRTNLKGAVIASAKQNKDGSYSDNGNLDMVSDQINVSDIHDSDTSHSQGFNLQTSGTSGNNGQYDSGSTTVGVNRSGHRKTQTTFAGLGKGNIRNSKGEAHDTSGINRDLNNTQKITKDQQTGGLDATVTVDHRLLSKEGRQSIKKDAIDTALHAGEIVQSVKDVVNTDQSTLDVFRNINDYAQERQVLAQQAADAGQQAKLRGDEGAEGSKEGLQDLSNELSKQQGLGNKADVGLYDGSQVTDNSLAIDKSAANKGQVAGAYHEKGKGIHVNIDKTDMTDSTQTVSTLVHEQKRHQLAQTGQTGKLSRDDQATIAGNHGDRASTVWSAYSGLGGHSTRGNSTQSSWNHQNRHSQPVQQGTSAIAGINSRDLKARQLNRNEASMLDKARDKINQSDLSADDKQQQLGRLDALACAEVNCAAGVPKGDAHYERLSALKKQGEDIKAQDNTDILSMLDNLGVDSKVEVTRTHVSNGILPKTTTTTTQEQQFQYGMGDKAQDLASKHTTAITDRLGSASEAMANGTITTAAGAAAAVGAVPTGFAEHMAETTRDNVDGVINHKSAVGQRATDSFSASTHQKSPNYVLDAAIAGVPGAMGAKAAAKKVMNKAGEAFKRTPKTADVPKSPDNNTVGHVQPEGKFSKLDDPADTYLSPTSPDNLRADVGHSQKTGSFVSDGTQKNTSKQGSVNHGNTAGDQEVTLYERYDSEGNFLKHGISQNPSTRYTKKELDGGFLVETQKGPRREILKVERELVETDPGPLNKEPWAGKKLKGKK